MNTTEVQTPWGTKQIVDFNIHGLKVGAKDGQCPKCSDQRSTNQKRKANCASYDWNTGVITCTTVVRNLKCIISNGNMRVIKYM